MPSKISQPAASEPSSTESAQVEPAQVDRPVWNPDVDSGLKLNTNPFEKFDYTGNSPPADAELNAPVTIRDAAVDTAPLQGSKDLSDDDHLGP